MDNGTLVWFGKMLINYQAAELQIMLCCWWATVNPSHPNPDEEKKLS